MNALLNFLSRTSCRIEFHAVLIALLLTGVFMVATASDLGAMGPLVISFGIYVMFFAIVAELLLCLRLCIAYLATRRLLIIKATLSDPQPFPTV